VLTMYSQSGGKNFTHWWQPSGTTIGALSYIPMQIYEPFHSRKFRAIPQDLVMLRTFRFAHVPSDYLLMRLPDSSCTLSSDQQTLDINDIAYRTFRQLSTEPTVTTIVQAVKALVKSRRDKETPDN
ncbi:hypothetical protein BD311DRAFT_678028, partial [Dichomitus squalens]